MPFDSPQIPASANNGETGKISAGKKAIARNSTGPFSMRNSEKESHNEAKNCLLSWLSKKSDKRKHPTMKNKKKKKYMDTFLASTCH